MNVVINLQVAREVLEVLVLQRLSSGNQGILACCTNKNLFYNFSTATKNLGLVLY